MKTTTLLMDKTDPDWKVICVYCSPSSGNLLVGMSKYESIGKVKRYNDSYLPTQTIPQNNTPDKLYENPCYITENNNGDVVVSDSGRRAVVVTSSKGIHRFSYKGSLPPILRINPRGICTDALSHILVCDASTNTVQMLNQDGEFLKYLLPCPSPGMDYYGLSYDFYTHCLWVASEEWPLGTTVSVYRHINRHPSILGKPEFSHTHLIQKNLYLINLDYIFG